MKNITLTTEQRNALISMIGLNQDATDQFGNTIRVQVTSWKDQRVYINTLWKSKRDESTYLSLTDSNDLVISFNSDSTAEMIMALINAEVERLVPAPVEETAAVTPIPAPVYEGAFKADFGWFSEVVLSSGHVVRQIEEAGGSYVYSIVAEGVDADDFMRDEGAEGEWAEIDEDEAERWFTEAS